MSETPLPPVPAPDVTHTAFARERRTLKEVLRQEWPLALLAMALAFVIFETGRGDIKREWVVENVQVLADWGTRSDTQVHFAEGQDTVSLYLDCTESEQEEAVDALVGADGKRRIVLRVGRTPASVQPYRELDASDQLVVPFPSSWLRADGMRETRRALKGWVYRVRESLVAVNPPSLVPKPPEGIEVDLRLVPDDRLSLVLMDDDAGENANVESFISARPLNLLPYLDPPPRDGQEVQGKVPLDFSPWRQAPGEAAQTLFRSKLELPRVMWRARFSVRDEAQTATNAFIYLVPESHRFDFRIDGRRRLAMEELRDELRASLFAPTLDRDDLVEIGKRNASGKQAPEGWVWGVAFDDELPTSTEEGFQEVRAHIQLVILAERFRGKPIRAQTTSEQRSFYVQVRRR